MEVTNKYKRVKCADIKVLRDERQRRDLELDEGFVDSIRKRGVLQPIIIDKELTLIAGERRLSASITCGLPDIPCRFLEDLTPAEAQIIELEENLRRRDLSWQDETRAIARLHELYSRDDPEWTRKQTAEAINVNQGVLSATLRVAEDIDSPRITGAGSMRAAWNILTRVDERKVADAVADIMEASTEIITEAKPPEGTIAPTAQSPAQLFTPTPSTQPPESLLNVDFIEWLETYDGPAFNFIHCDFPYGINAFGGAMSGRDKWQTYNDSPDVYWKLIGALCSALPRIMSHSAHLMFWFSMEHYAQTLEAFRQLAPFLEFSPFPLVWHKTDNVGILPDAKRGPRRVYETALIASREDRLILRAVSNVYGAPTDKAHHPSTKPEPMLRHFFQMFVDDTSRVLDPTCGSGSALRAAESLGAKHVLGLERDPEHFNSARSALRTFRSLRKATGGK